MNQVCQIVWFVAPTEEKAIELAKKHRGICYSYAQALALQMAVLGRGHQWPIWEMRFDVTIEMRK